MTGSAPPPASPYDATPQASGRDYVVRSEEQLRVRTDQQVAGYARLEKFTVTETQTITVEVTHEEVRLVQRGVADPQQGEPAPAGPVGSDGGRWMVLSREEVVVSKRIVPVERVRLEVYPVTEQQQVTEQVRKEQIDATPEIDSTATHAGGPLT